jgi:hypothetical protein
LSSLSPFKLLNKSGLFSAKKVAICSQCEP